MPVTLHKPFDCKVNVPLTIKAHSVSIVSIVIPKITEYSFDSILSSV